ncbi:hypothetical protein [Paraburkholderia fungorum]
MSELNGSAINERSDTEEENPAKCGSAQKITPIVHTNPNQRVEP